MYLKDMNKFGEWLLRELEGRGLSQSELARHTGLTRSAISYYLSERSKRPADAALKRIARALDMPLEDVYRAAGILPTENHTDAITRATTHIMESLPSDERRRIYEYARLTKKLSEDKQSKTARRNLRRVEGNEAAG